MRLSHPLKGLVMAVIGIVSPAAAQAPAASYWCEPARGYYPQVQSCPVPWRPLDPPQPVLQPARPPAGMPYPTQYAPYDNYNHGSGP